jgi:hypothetical protein
VIFPGLFVFWWSFGAVVSLGGSVVVLWLVALGGLWRFSFGLWFLLSPVGIWLISVVSLVCFSGLFSLWVLLFCSGLLFGRWGWFVVGCVVVGGLWRFLDLVFFVLVL